MCGITGIVDLRGERDIDRALLERMNDAQYHRGPDESGMHVERGVGLGHRRLSIIDLKSGQQPLANEDGSVIVVYNGEIYNFQELAVELQAVGHTFRTHCDTEVIVHAWEEWGADCVQRFRGMFAFALWDRNRRELFLARDRLGIKPLYYAVLPDATLLFASELKSLLLHPGLSREIDVCAVEEYFAFGYVPEPRTILEQAKKLSPGHTVVARIGEAGELREQRYWDVPFEPVAVGNERDLQLELIERLREAVRIRLIAEVPLGAFLSGGVDSSAVVAMMAQLNGDDPVNTCSIGFGEPRFNETQYADQVAARYHTRHHVEHVEADDFELLEALGGFYDEPYADSSAIPTYRVCELARKRVTVALSGDGGDENFAGYTRYRWHMNEEQVRRRVPASLRRVVFGIGGALYPKLDWAPKVLRAKSTLQSLGRDAMAAYLHSVSVTPDYLRRKLYSREFRQRLQGHDAMAVFRRHMANAPVDDALSMVQYLDMKTYLPGDILTKVDRASMAHSLEVRVPILDHLFVEWVSGLPPGLKLRGREGKYVFKKALEPYLSDDILYRQKMGFAVPIGSWFRGPRREQVRERLLGDSLAAGGYFDRGFLTRVVEQHQSGRSDHTGLIWSLLMFESFQRRVVEA